VKGLLAALSFFLLAAPAQADLTVTPSTAQAGAHADVDISASFVSTPTSVVLHLPPGLVGNPNAVPRCTVADFQSGAGCPANTAVGSAQATVRTPLPLTATGSVYNLVPAANEPARLGIDVGLAVVRVKNQASVTLRPDGGLDSTIAALDDGGMGVSALQLTLNSSFMTLPTSCAPATTTIEAPPNAPAAAAFTPTGCDKVPFDPAVAATLETTQRIEPSGATVTLTVPAGGTIRQAHVRRAEIALPVGTTLSPGVADGLQTCSDDQFAQTACPAASQIGTVSFVTPLLGTLGGNVYFGPAVPGAPYRLFIVVQGSGVLVKLAGDVRLDPATGQITTVFDNLPQVPVTSFALTFQGGPHAVLANPTACGPKTLSALLTPWSGGPAKTATATFTIDADGKGGACTAASFTPSLRVTAGSTLAGRPAGAVTLEISRPDGSEDIARVTTELPPGLAGSLKGVPVCSDAQADAGTCPAATGVGSVSAQAGSGTAPVTLSGSVSLTGPTDGGLAGLAIAIAGRVGPVDLGTVVVRASIVLRADGGLTVRTRPLPQMIDGVPVSIRSLALTLDRPGFILNASSCAAQQVKALLDGVNGGSATVTAPYQATDCLGLPFAPRLEATVGARGKTASGSHPPLSTVVTVPDGQAATAVAKVDLPNAIGIDLMQLAKACPEAAYAAGTCPASSQIGTASASTPLLPAPLSGPVNLAVAHAGDLPGLALTLRGAVTLSLFGTVPLPGADGVIHNTFAGIPDVPLARFELAFKGGANSPLNLSRDVCHGPRQTVRAQFTGYNGVVANVSAPLRVVGCAPVVSLTRRGHRLTLRLTRGRDAAALKRATLVLPKGLGHATGRGLKGRTLTLRKVRTTTLRITRLPGKRTFRLTIHDTSGQAWKRTLRAKTPR
jgi:hypothetical protein